jgi:zinc/manganese transport system permease protein
MSLLHDEFSILAPAMIAGLLVVLSHVPLGMQVLSRGIVFIDLAVAQVAGLGVIAARSLGLGAEGWGTQMAAVVAALLGALLLTWSERKRRGAGSADRRAVRARLHGADHPARQRSAWRQT